MRLYKSRKGTILILALWSLGLLVVLTLSVGTRIQQKVLLVSRIEKRTRVYDTAEAGIRKAVALLKSQMKTQPQTPQKTVLFNDPPFFKNIGIGSSTFDVSYTDPDAQDISGRTYGILDEERKLNVNTADQKTLGNLFKDVANLSEDASKDLASAIIDWREYGESKMDGFLGEEYYGNLRFPYKQKKGVFETLDELLLIKGMSPALYRQLSPYITVYGEGKVNLNTAPKAVLKALGMSEALVEAILVIRRGKDGREATLDDVLFPPESEAPMMRMLVAVVEPQDAQYAFDLYVQNKIGMKSSHYMIQSQGYLNNTAEKKDLACVFDVDSGKIKYWREY